MDAQLHLAPIEDGTEAARPRRRYGRLSTATIEHGRQGVAAARASLEAARRRRHAEEAARANRHRPSGHAA